MRRLNTLYLTIMAPVSSSPRYVWATRRAWWFTATARTRERFASTVLGSFWLGLSTLLSLGVLAVVYGTVFKVQDFRSYVVYLGTGLVIWNSLSASIHSATTLLAHNSVKLKGTNINPIFFTFEEWAFQVQAFLQSFGLVLLALLPFRVDMLGNLLTVGLLPLLNLLLFMY
jgi:lipopolysaccharide transport system permease protein